jgi:prepilin-type N-terminal cleavage/methylation domain-containing protein/prepilin-type processing-associated H-X9-DG protein
MKKKTAFTLIELLVVIAIIGLLLSILIPGLQYVKESATAIVCGVNQAGLTRAWYLYQENNGGNLVGLSNYYPPNGRPTPYRWIEVPVVQDTDIPGPPPDGKNSAMAGTLTYEYRLNGIRAGKLFPYTETEKLYHCPNDKYWKKNPPATAAYISYAGAGLMNSEDFRGGTRVGWPGYVPPSGWRTVTTPSGSRRLQLVEKFHEIKSPGEKYAFVEEDYVMHGQAYYAGGFVLMGDGTTNSWWDWPAGYHNDRSTLAFADGHSEKHKWTDDRTISIMTQTPMPGGGGIAPALQANNVDLEWMIRGYLPAGWR